MLANTLHVVSRLLGHNVGKPLNHSLRLSSHNVDSSKDGSLPDLLEIAYVVLLETNNDSLESRGLFLNQFNRKLLMAVSTEHEAAPMN